MNRVKVWTWVISMIGYVSLGVIPIWAQQGGTPLKVFILAGQSNMEGFGEMVPATTPGTLDFMVASDPATFGHLKEGSDWVVRDDVWITYRRGGTTLLNGGLSAGYGVNGSTIGPELEFGFTLGDYFGEQVLLIKTAWGGKSLFTDFRPPSSGWSVDPPVSEGDQGYFYQQMLLDIQDTLNNLSTYHPGYDAAAGYEFVGFGWHQGWNDRVNAAAVLEYEANMENFIKDVRTDLAAIHPSGAGLPFVIANTGIDGMEVSGRGLDLVNAQLAMEDFTIYPEFEGNVAVVDTREFARTREESPSNQGFHWFRNAETYFLIGQAMATHMRVLVEGGDTTPPTPDPMTWETPPTAAGEGEITMTATTATDIIGVEYYFECLTAGGHDSGWQDRPSYTDTGLANSTSYAYRVRARDESPDVNVTGWSPTVTAVTTPPDATPPTPDPMAWAVPPAALSSRGIIMTAATASDPSGVEYRFTNLSVAGRDSGWQESPTFIDLGLDPGTSYTYQVQARDKSAAANETLPSASATTSTLAAPAPGAAIYEPFDDPDPTLNGNTPGPGLSGTWSGGMSVEPGSLSFGSLATSGNRARKQGTTGFQSATISESNTLRNLALLEPTSELWFSALIVSTSADASQRTYLTLGTGRADGFDRIGGNAGFGLGVRVNAGSVFAHGWSGGAIKPPGTAVPDGPVLVVAKVTWGQPGEEDRLEVFVPGTDLQLPATAASELSFNFDQSTFNTISFAGGTSGVPEVDEIRFGATYADVVPIVEDTEAPSPDPMTWASVPTAVNEAQITMTATTATDSSGVEYYFEETTGNPGGDDSGWQASPSYVDTGLQPSTTYAYRVRARDLSSSANETSPSTLESVTTPTLDLSSPVPDPPTWALVPTADSSISITMTATTASDPSGVEYYFEETSGNPGGDDSGWIDSPTYTDVGLSPATTYSYRFRVRDKSPTANLTGFSTEESTATGAAPVIPLIYEPFDDLDPTLNGNVAGAGLSGPWSAEGGLDILAASLTYSNLATSGGRVFSSAGNFRDAEVAVGSTLSDTGVLDDGAVLWFSALGHSPGGTGSRSYLSLGTGGPDGFDRIGDNGGFGLGVRLENGIVTTHGWQDRSAIKPVGATVSPGTVFFVGKITWAAVGSDDVLELYLPGPDLTLPTTPVSTLVGDFDQSTFTTLGFAVHPSPGDAFDEIRFGLSYESVVPVAAAADDYSVWAALFAGVDLSDRGGDLDGDGMTNDEERLFGLDPTDGSSVNPITAGLDATAGTLSYSRRDPALTGAIYTYEWSTSLAPGEWTAFIPQAETTDAASPVETVTLTLSPTLLANSRLFVRVIASE